jgi:hypothetical protein
MVKVLSASTQAAASAWRQAGFLGDGALGGAALLWLAARLPLLPVGVCVAVLIALPGFLLFLFLNTRPCPLPGSEAAPTTSAVAEPVRPNRQRALGRRPCSPNEGGMRCF